jgi:hypothetical protein
MIVVWNTAQRQLRSVLTLSLKKVNITVQMYSRVVNLQFLILYLHLESKSAFNDDGFLQPEFMSKA